MNSVFLNYVVAHALIGILPFVVGFFVFLQDPKRYLNRVFLLYNSCMSWWGFFNLFQVLAKDSQAALFWDRVSLIGIVFIPTTFLHFTLTFLAREQLHRRLVRICYGLSAFFCIVSWTELMAPSVSRKHYVPFFTDPGPLYHFFLLFFALVMMLALWFSYRAFVDTQIGSKKTVNFYFLVAAFIAAAGGSGNFFVPYNFFLPVVNPYGTYGVVIYAFITAYLILRYRFLDIEVIIRKTLVFAGLFTLIFGFFAFLSVLVTDVLGKSGGMVRWLAFAVAAAVVALVSRRLEAFLINVTDKFLFQKQFDYKKILRDASAGISRIKSLHHLSMLVVHFMTMRMRVKTAAVLVREERRGRFSLAYTRGYFEQKELVVGSYHLDETDPLLGYMAREHTAVDIERIKERIESGAGGKAASKNEAIRRYFYDYEAIKARMDELKSSCCVPSFLGAELRSVLVLGEKKSGDYYSDGDLDVLYTIAQESAIAIENARLYDQAIQKARELESINKELESAQSSLLRALDETEVANKRLRDTQMQLIHEQKMATLGRLASSVGHEVNNPLTILSMNVSRAILKYRRNPDLKVVEILDVFQKMEQNIGRIKAVVNTLTGLLKKSERGKFEPLSLKLVLEETLPLVQFQTYLENLSGTEVEFDIPGSVPLIKGDLERLQEVFLNLFINAYQAMAGRRDRKISVKAYQNPTNPLLITIEFSDNGSGIADEVMKKIFNYGFTTKPAGKGSGIGLYMCRYIIELHGGEIKVRSQVGTGTTFVITLPVYQEESSVDRSGAGEGTTT